MADSSATEWQPRLGEQFIHEGKHYDLAKAKTIIKGAPRAVENKPVAMFRPMYFSAVKIDWDKAEKTDPTIPCILAMEGGKVMLIDGWHRYAKALRARLSEIPVVALTEEETASIRR